MGKLELSHFADKPTKRPARRGPPKRDEVATTERFGSLVEGNPFKTAGEEVRRNRRRNTRGRINAQEKSNIKSSSPLLRSYRGNERLPSSDNQIISRRMRNTVPDLKIDEETIFPELGNNASNQETPIAAKGVPAPAARDTDNPWLRNGKDVVTAAAPVKATTPTNSDTIGPIRPGWVRLSRNGCEYGPKSENYGRLLELQQQTMYVIHREFFARNHRMMNDGYDDEGCDGGFFSDDETMSDCDYNDYYENSDDDDSDNDY